MRDILVKDWPGLDPATAKLLQENDIDSLKLFIECVRYKEWRKRLLAAGLKKRRILALGKDAERRIAALPEVTIHGVIGCNFATSTEGVEWAVYENGKTGCEGPHTLENGDHLVVRDKDGTIRFDGIIRPDYKKGWEPDDWASLFFPPDIQGKQGPPLRAVLTVNKKKK